jgi:flagellar hook-associated protein 1 FlgK
MAGGIYGVALTGLGAAQAGLQTTGHNLSNVNTPYFSRQELVQAPGAAQYSGVGFIGAGVAVESVRRVYADFLQAQSQAAGAQTAHYSAYSSEIERLSNLLADPDVSVAGAMDGFFSSVQQLAAHPSDPASRQALLSSAQSMVGRFNAFDANIRDLAQRNDGRLRASLGNVNSSAQQFAQLNDAIVRAQASGQPPNDLLDQRDRLLAAINAEVRAVAVPESDGRVNLFLPNGQPLVVGATALPLAAVSSPLDPSSLDIGLQMNGGVRRFNEGELTGGTLGGLLAFRDEVLVPTRNAMGRLALALGSAVNEQHRLGQDRSGLPGGDFFALASPRALSSVNNAGTATMAATIADCTALTASDYRIAYDGSGYTVTRLSDGTASTFATLPQTVDGLVIGLSGGVPASGDDFLIQPTRDGAGALAVLINNANQVAAAAPIRTGSAASNAGGAAISAGRVDSRSADLTQAVTLTFTSATSFDVAGVGTGNPTGLLYTSGGDISFNGWTASVTGTPQAGDTFTIVPNVAGSGDNRNALRWAERLQANLVEDTSLPAAYAQIVASVGSKAQEVATIKAAHQGLWNEARQSLSSVSGVNLDEEAANLLRYQQAYQAAGKLIAVANNLFDSILALHR